MLDLAAMGAQALRVVLQLSMHASVIVGVVLIIQFALGGRMPARWRYAMWGVVAARLLLPWNYEVPVLPVTPHVTHTEPAITQPVFGPGQKSGPLRTATPSVPINEFPPPFETHPVAPQSALPQASPASSRFSSLDAWTVATAIWLLGVVGVPCAVFLHHHKMTARIRRTSTAAPRWVRDALEDVGNEFGIAARPQVLVTSKVHSPTLLGVTRPQILLPDSLVETSSRSDMRLFLLHELTHLRAGDIWFSWLWCFALSLHWFNPLLWWTGTRIRKDRETACDESVVRRIGLAAKEEYAHALLRAVSNIGQRSQQHYNFGLVGIAENKSEISHRIDSILTLVVHKKRRRLAGALTLAALLAASFIHFVPALNTVDAQESEIKDDENPSPAAMSAFIQAVDSEMQRIKERITRGDAYRDKSDLSQAYRESKEQGIAPNGSNFEQVIQDLSTYLGEHEGDKGYGWRIWHLKSLIAQDFEDEPAAGEESASLRYLRQAAAQYPRTKYPVPSKHSKFQHIVNEIAMLIWNREGFDAAEQYVADTWRNDRRFVYFYDQPWRQRMEAEGMDQDRLESLLARLSEKPPLRKVEILLTPNALYLEGEPMPDLAALEDALANIENPHDHYIAMGISTDDITLRRFRQTQDELMRLVSKLQFDHLSDIGVQHDSPAGPTAVEEQANAAEDGTYTQSLIEDHEASYFLERLARPDPGYHRFAALWAAQYKAASGDERERKEIVELALTLAEDSSQAYAARYQSCYLASSFEIPSTIERLATILREEQIAPLRGVAAYALGHFEAEAAKSELRDALEVEKDETVLASITNAISGRFPRPMIWKPGIQPQS